MTQPIKHTLLIMGLMSIPAIIMLLNLALPGDCDYCLIESLTIGGGDMMSYGQTPLLMIITTLGVMLTILLQYTMNRDKMYSMLLFFMVLCITTGLLILLQVPGLVGMLYISSMFGAFIVKLFTPRKLKVTHEDLRKYFGLEKYAILTTKLEAESIASLIGKTMVVDYNSWIIHAIYYNREGSKLIFKGISDGSS